MRTVKINFIQGSPYDVESVMEELVGNRIPISAIDYGNIGEEYENIPFMLFRITVNADVPAKVFERFAKVVELNHEVETVYVRVNDITNIYIRPNTDTDFKGILD